MAEIGRTGPWGFWERDGWIREMCGVVLVINGGRNTIPQDSFRPRYREGSNCSRRMWRRVHSENICAIFNAYPAQRLGYTSSIS